MKMEETWVTANDGWACPAGSTSILNPHVMVGLLDGAAVAVEMTATFGVMADTPAVAFAAAAAAPSVSAAATAVASASVEVPAVVACAETGLEVSTAVAAADSVDADLMFGEGVADEETVQAWSALNSRPKPKKQRPATRPPLRVLMACSKVPCEPPACPTLRQGSTAEGEICLTCTLSSSADSVLLPDEIVASSLSFWASFFASGGECLHQPPTACSACGQTWWQFRVLNGAISVSLDWGGLRGLPLSF